MRYIIDSLAGSIMFLLLVCTLDLRVLALFFLIVPVLAIVGSR